MTLTLSDFWQSAPIENGDRHVLLHKITGGKKPGIFNIAGLGAHGWGQRAEFLHDECLAQKRNFVALTPSGLDLMTFDHLAQRAIITDFNMARWVEDADASFDHHTNGSQIVVANSGGSLAGLHLATRYPDRVAGLILIAPMVNIDDAIEPLFEAIPSTKTDFNAKGYFDIPVPPMGSVRYQRFLRVTRQAVDAAREFCQRNQQHPFRVQCPVVILHDRADWQIPFRSSEKLLENIQSPHRPKLIEAPGIDHTHNKEPDHRQMLAQINLMLCAFEPA
jgi:pimeloyl-ACP methyl ester carboxylesterase